MMPKEQEMYARHAGRWVETRFMGTPIKICVTNEKQKRIIMNNLEICFGIGGCLSKEDRIKILKDIWEGFKDGDEEPVKPLF